MRIVELNKRDFDDFAFNHPYRSYYQTSQYGTLMSKHGFSSLYIGLEDNGHIIAASLILVKSAIFNINVGYSPRGYLIDFNDYPLLEQFTFLLKEYLASKRITYLIIDPHITHLERDKNGKPLENGQNGVNISESLKRMGYEHNGFTLYFENLKPRWNMILKSRAPKEIIFNSFDKITRTKVRNSLRKGVEVFKGNKDDLRLFYQMINRKQNRKFDYYLDMYDIFGKFNMFDVYFARINTEVFLKNSKLLYEHESAKNAKLNEQLQRMITDSKAKAKLLNKKIESDRLLNSYKNDIVYGTKLYRDRKYIVIACNAVVTYGDEVFFLIDGINFKFKNFNANHLLKWKVIEHYKDAGFTKFNFNGITGDFTKKNKYYGLYEFKKGFNTTVTEYIGEYVLVVNRVKYNAFKNIEPVKNLIISSMKKS